MCRQGCRATTRWVESSRGSTVTCFASRLDDAECHLHGAVGRRTLRVLHVVQQTELVPLGVEHVGLDGRLCAAFGGDLPVGHHLLEHRVGLRVQLVAGREVGRVARLTDLRDHVLDPAERLGRQLPIAARLSRDCRECRFTGVDRLLYRCDCRRRPLQGRWGQDDHLLVYTSRVG